MRLLRNFLLVVAVALTGFGLFGATVASAETTASVPGNVASDSQVAPIPGWRWAGYYDNWVECNLDGVGLVAVGIADDYDCTEPDEGSLKWSLWLYDECECQPAPIKTESGVSERS